MGVSKNAQILREKAPHLNTVARDMVLCREEAKRYAICVSAKGMVVEHQECLKQFTALMTCLGRTPRK